MKFEEIKLDKCYIANDSLCKVIAKGINWISILCYSFSRRSCCMFFIKSDDEWLKDWTNSDNSSIFDQLEYEDDYTLFNNAP